ncbi:PAT complex subunit Asterix-like [Argiope bruennichi]|uniref:PAT complex subunit Asterix-like n=1 Tax=Argiope bruennichi TaxID=94029 RepID=UPI002494ACEC|nr:PAT complex subunit Asterix-like [Argiope bruennichi]
MPSNRINNRNDPRRPNQIHRHPARSYDDQLAKCLIVLTIVFSLYGLYTKRSWCTWMSLYCACRCFANSPVDNNQGFCCLVTTVNSLVCYNCYNHVLLTKVSTIFLGVC